MAINMSPGRKYWEIIKQGVYTPVSNRYAEWITESCFINGDIRGSSNHDGKGNKNLTGKVNSRYGVFQTSSLSGYFNYAL